MENQVLYLNLSVPMFVYIPTHLTILHNHILTISTTYGVSYFFRCHVIHHLTEFCGYDWSWALHWTSGASYFKSRSQFTGKTGLFFDATTQRLEVSGESESLKALMGKILNLLFVSQSFMNNWVLNWWIGYQFQVSSRTSGWRLMLISILAVQRTLK